jgi:hypothetical protein
MSVVFDEERQMKRTGIWVLLRRLESKKMRWTGSAWRQQVLARAAAEWFRGG